MSDVSISRSSVRDLIDDQLNNGYFDHELIRVAIGNAERHQTLGFDPFAGPLATGEPAIDFTA